MNLRFLSIQLALFFSEPLKKGMDQISSDLRQGLQVFRDSSPLLLPLPTEAPPEIPRLRLQSGRNYTAQVALSRADLFYQHSEPVDQATYEQEIDDIHSRFHEFFYIISSGASIVRVGYITRFVFEHDDPANFIRKNFIRPEKLDSVNELNVRYNIRHSDDLLVLNDITEIKNAVKRDGGEAVHIQKDLNSIQGQRYLFDKALFSKLVEKGKILSSFDAVKNTFSDHA